MARDERELERDIAATLHDIADALQQIAKNLNAVLAKDDRNKFCIRIVDIDRARDPS